MKKILVIQGHPNPKSLCAHLAETYQTNAEQTGNEVQLLNLPELKFDLSLHLGYTDQQKLEPDLVTAQQAILWADHLVFVFPNWWTSMPALLKGFIDRVFLPGFAFQYQEKSPLPKKLLKNKSARLIISMDSPAWYYNYLMKAPGVNLLKRGTLEFCGIKPVKVTTLGPVRKAPVEKLNKFIEKVKHLGTSGS